MKKALLFLVVIIAILGGIIVYQNLKNDGTSPVVTTPSNTVPTKPATSTQPTAPSTTTSTSTSTSTPPSTPTPTDTTLAPIDNTWLTFTSRNGAWTFQHAVKGKFAPEWEQFYVPLAGNATYKVNGDCVSQFEGTTNSSFTSQDGTVFCHASQREGAMSHTEFYDTYATKYGNQYLVLSFKKRAVTNPVGLVQGCEPEKASTATNPACQPYDGDTYGKTLDQIMGTFKFNTTTTN